MTAASVIRAKLDAFTSLPGARILTWIRRDVVLATFALNVLALALPLVLLQVYNRIIPNAATQTLTLLIVGLGVCLVLEAALRLARSYLAGWAGAKFEHETGCRLANKLFSAKLKDLERVPVGTHLDRFNAIEPVRDFYSNQAALLFVDLPFVLLYLAFLTFISGALTLVPIAIILLFLAASTHLAKHLREALAARTMWDDRRRSLLIEVLSGIHTVKGLAMEALMMRRFERLQDSSVMATYNVTYLGALAQTLGTTFSTLSMVSITAIGSLGVIHGSLSIGGLAASVMLAGRTIQPLLQAVGIFTQYQNVRLSQERIGEILSYPTEQDGRGGVKESISGDIRLVALSFSHAPGAPALLNDINLEIRAGETIGILGENGSGKSTLLWLLFGGVAPTGGKILFSDTDARDLDLATLRRQIAYIPQSGKLFHGTILDNLTLYRGGGAIDRATSLAAEFGLDRYFASMPAGFDTIVGDGITNTLPAGIIQRIAIVRALVDAPKLLLFDDANSSLDSEGDKRMIEILKGMRGDTTIVLVSHRPSLLALADRVFTLRSGALHPRASDSRR